VVTAALPSVRAPHPMVASAMDPSATPSQCPSSGAYAPRTSAGVQTLRDPCQIYARDVQSKGAGQPPTSGEASLSSTTTVLTSTMFAMSETRRPRRGAAAAAAGLSRLRLQQHGRLLPPRVLGKGPVDVRDAQAIGEASSSSECHGAGHSIRPHHHPHLACLGKQFCQLLRSALSIF
jgi:hypothetical protein